MKSYIFKKNDIKKFVLAIMAYVAVARAWLAFSYLEYSPFFYYFNQIMNYLCIVTGVFLILNCGVKVTKERFRLIFLSVVYPFFCFFYTVGRENIIPALFSLFSCLIFVLLPEIYQIEVFDIFYKIVFYTSEISCILYVLYAVRMNIGFKIVPYYSFLYFQNGFGSYIKFFIFAIYKNNIELRLCGIFNEPGALGTICALLLIARYEYMKKYEKIVMLITILFTFSLAGFILIFVFYAFRIVSKNPKNFLLIFAFVAIFLLLPYMDFGNERINIFFDRISITENGLAGMNRTKKWFDESYEAFMHTNDKWFGRKEGYTFPNDYGGTLSYKIYIVEYGIIGFGFWLFLWIYNGLRSANKNKNAILLIIFFVISLYQRPRVITGLYGFVLLFGGIKWLNANAKFGKR